MAGIRKSRLLLHSTIPAGALQRLARLARLAGRGHPCRPARLDRSGLRTARLKQRGISGGLWRRVLAASGVLLAFPSIPPVRIWEGSTCPSAFTLRTEDSSNAQNAQNAPHKHLPLRNLPVLHGHRSVSAQNHHGLAVLRNLYSKVNKQGFSHPPTPRFAHGCRCSSPPQLASVCCSSAVP